MNWGLKSSLIILTALILGSFGSVESAQAQVDVVQLPRPGEIDTTPVATELVPVRCGDGVINPNRVDEAGNPDPEQCDEGENNGPEGYCDSTCHINFEFLNEDCFKIIYDRCEQDAWEATGDLNDVLRQECSREAYESCKDEPEVPQPQAPDPQDPEPVPPENPPIMVPPDQPAPPAQTFNDPGPSMYFEGSGCALATAGVSTGALTWMIGILLAGLPVFLRRRRS